MVTGDANARGEDGAAWLRDLADELALPAFSAYGVREQDIPRVVAEARRASSMQGNPIVLTEDELAATLRAAI